MKIGYMRVSTEEQTNDLQEDALRKAGCEKIFSDKVSGKTTSRKGLDAAVSALAPGDIFVVWKLDRVGRTLKHIKDFTTDLEARNISFASLTEKIDTSTPSGKLFFHMMAAFAEFERDNLIERTNAGIEAAQARGVHCGRPKAVTDEVEKKVLKLLKQKVSMAKIAAQLGITKSSVQRISERNAEDLV